MLSLVASRSDLLRSLLVLPAAARVAPATRGVVYSSDDGAFNFALPNGNWRIASECTPSRNRDECSSLGRRVLVTADRVNGEASMAATVDIAAFGKTLSEFGSLSQVTDSFAGVMPTFRLLESSALTSKSGRTAKY